MKDDVMRIGRGPQNDFIIQGSGPEVASVSLQHLEIRRVGDGFQLRDLQSTNGTFLNGERTLEAAIAPPATIRLGSQGPELNFTREEPHSVELHKTMAIAEPVLPAAPGNHTGASSTHEALLVEAVNRLRRARLRAVGDQTLTIMRETLGVALRHSRRRMYYAIVFLGSALLAVAGLAAWRIASLDRERSTVNRRIRDLELQLQNSAGKLAESDRLIAQLNEYQNEAQQLESSVLYRFTPHFQQDFLTQEIRTLMAEFGAEVYSVPPEFTEQVRHYVEEYQGPNRPLVANALEHHVQQLRIMRQVLKEEQLPQDLAYIPLVESALAPESASRAGAVGPWQMTAVTVRSIGLQVDKQVDERTDLAKSTRGSCRYLRQLILEFGSGSSVMLALAAYNLGPTKVKQAIMNTVKDPIKQRSFWYLYRVGALPKETREYVPKVVAAMIIGRNPHHFGF